MYQSFPFPIGSSIYMGVVKEVETSPKENDRIAREQCGLVEMKMMAYVFLCIF